MTGKVTSVNIVHAVIPDIGGTVGFTSIDKRPVLGPVSILSTGLAGDSCSDTANHGSLPQAIYCYGSEDLKWWSNELGFEVEPGSFGENITISGIDLNNLVIGTHLRVGSSLLEATLPRIPCGTFQRWMNQDQWVKRFTKSGRTGTYFKVLSEGFVQVGDNVEVEMSPSHGLKILDYFKVYSGDRNQNIVQALVNCPDLVPNAKEKISKFLEK